MVSSRYDVARDHIADFLIFRSSALSFWFSLNTSYDHLATDETAVVATATATATAMMAMMATMASMVSMVMMTTMATMATAAAAAVT